MIEFGGRVELKLTDNSIQIGGKEVRIPNNIHNFYTAGAYAFYGLSYTDKPPRAVFYDRGARLVLYQDGNGAVILLYEKGEEKVGRLLRKEELGLFLDWVRGRTKAVPVDELVFYKKGELLCVNGLELSEPSRRVIFYALEGWLRRKEEGSTEDKARAVSFKEGRMVMDRKRIVFLKKEGGGYVPEGNITLSQDNVLRLMSVL